MVQKIKQQWFLLALAIVFLCVTLDPTGGLLVRTGLFLKSIQTPQMVIFLIFIISGLLIDDSQIMAGIKDHRATLAALFVIIVFAPFAALMLSRLSSEPGIVVGLYIIAVMPTTLSSGIVMTGTAGGNMAHALFITIVSNFICILTIPVILPLLLGGTGGLEALEISRGNILIKLILLVLFPLLIGMVLKRQKTRLASLPQKPLQLLNQWMIVLIVFISLSGSQNAFLENRSVFAAVSGLAVLFHLTLLCASFFLVTWLGIGPGRRESVIFMGSQKTLALAATIQVTYFGAYPAALLMCVIHHILHLMMDGYLCTRLGKQREIRQ